MTRTVQASDAKTRLLQILDAVEKGETFVITRRGRPVARLSPEADARRAELESAIAEIRAIGRRNGKVTADELVAWRDEGRRV